MLADRFAQKYVEDPQTGCYVWCAGRTCNGYGRFRASFGVIVYAHSWAYQHYVGPVPEGMELEHKCGVRLCVNPKHLEPVSYREALASCDAGKTHCRRGHELAERSVAQDGVPVPERRCRLCAALREQRYRRWREAALSKGA